VRASGGLDVLRGVVALRDLLQRDVVAGFRTDVEEGQPVRAQRRELFVALGEDVARHGVAGDAAKVREELLRAFEDR
jgi:hypothetical protein